MKSKEGRKGREEERKGKTTIGKGDVEKGRVGKKGGNGKRGKKGGKGERENRRRG